MIAHRKKIGDIEVTALSDGVLATSIDVVLGMDRAELRRLAGNTDGVHIAVNAFLLKLGGTMGADRCRRGHQHGLLGPSTWAKSSAPCPRGDGTASDFAHPTIAGAARDLQRPLLSRHCRA
jgi:hypothetical protein